MMCTCAQGCPAYPVWRDHINHRPLRHRLAYNADGTGSHSGQRAEHFAGHFYDRVCTPIVRDLEGFSRFGGGTGVNWIGNVGVTVCKAGMHGLGRAFDLTRVEMHGWSVDCNTAWRSDRSLASRRRYVGVAATCRVHAGTVLTTWYNAAHGNHIHVDNGVPFTIIRQTMRSDTTLVQASCNLLNSAGLAVDGAWGPLTDAAYHALRFKLGLGGLDPRTSASHARTFLVHIAVIALAGRAA
jgi:hypothetical protein